MSENVQGKSGLFSWLNENFEKIFMVTGLLAIILFITWQVIYRYIITQFIERAGAAVWTEEPFPLYLYLDLLSGPFRRHQEAVFHPRRHHL